MHGEIAGLIAEAVDSQLKLELVSHFVSHPEAEESVPGLAACLDSDPVEVDLAVRELTGAGFLRGSGPPGFGPGCAFRWDRADPRAALWQRLATVAAGPDRERVLRLVTEAERLSVLRRLAADRRLHDLQTRFLAMVSDQLRNPVSTIMGLTVSLLAGRDHLDAQQIRSLELIEQHCQALIRLVEDLLLSSSLKDGAPLTLNPAPFDLVNLAREVESDFAAENGDYQWSLALPEKPLLVDADRAQVRQVYGVLVRNSLKFSPAGTRLTIGAGGNGDWVWGAVEDEGPGVSPAAEARLFQLFYQAETDATRLSGGLGLGLYLARIIIEAHGGDINTQPKPGPGLRVVFRLPADGQTSDFRHQTSDSEGTGPAEGEGSW
jgi:signal transduction histidine kinase